MAALGIIWADGVWNNSIWDTAIWEQTGGDVTAPTLSSPTATATGTTTGSGSVTTDEAGTGYWIATTVNGTPTYTQIQAGQDSSGTATAVIDDNHSSPASWTVGINNISITGGTQGTLYYVYYQSDDASSNHSSVVGVSFTTFSTGGGSGTARVTSSGGLRGVKVL